MTYLISVTKTRTGQWLVYVGGDGKPIKDLYGKNLSILLRQASIVIQTNMLEREMHI